MRRVAFLTAFALLASPAHAGGRSTVVVRPAKPMTRPTPTPPVMFKPFPAPAPDPAQCRIACASSRYQCDAANDADVACAARWSQCVAACAAPPR